MRRVDWRLKGVAIVATVVGCFALGVALSGSNHAAAVPVPQTIASPTRALPGGNTAVPGAVAHATAASPLHGKPKQLFLTRAHSTVFNVKKLKSVVVKKE